MDDPDELARQQQQQPGPLTYEAIERDPWNAVNLPLPENADCQLLAEVADMAARLADEKRNAACTILYDDGPGSGDALEAEADRADRRLDEAIDRYNALAGETSKDEKASERLSRSKISNAMRRPPHD